MFLLHPLTAPALSLLPAIQNFINLVQFSFNYSLAISKKNEKREVTVFQHQRSLLFV